MIVSDSKQDLGVFSRKAVLTEVGNRRLQARVRCRPQASLVTVATLLVDHRLRRGTRTIARQHMVRHRPSTCTKTLSINSTLDIMQLSALQSICIIRTNRSWPSTLGIARTPTTHVVTTLDNISAILGLWLTWRRRFVWVLYFVLTSFVRVLYTLILHKYCKDRTPYESCTLYLVYRSCTHQ
jgi:hypothetical protein